MDTVNESSQSTGPTSADGTTCVPGRSPIQSESMLSAEGFRASQSATTDIRTTKTMSVGCGRTCSESFAHFDRDSQSWRTYQGCLFGPLEPFSETWPQSGMTRNGKAYRRRRLVCHKRETAYSLWPTPTASDAKRVSDFSLAVLIADFHRRPDGAYFTGAIAAELGCYQTAEITAWAMGFPQNWLESVPQATP